MPSADEFHAYAREALGAAASAESGVERQAFLDMAKTWEQAALQSEEVAPSTVTDPTRDPAEGEAQQ